MCVRFSDSHVHPDTLKPDANGQVQTEEMPAALIDVVCYLLPVASVEYSQTHLCPPGVCCTPVQCMMVQIYAAFMDPRSYQHVTAKVEQLRT